LAVRPASGAWNNEPMNKAKRSQPGLRGQAEQLIVMAVDGLVCPEHDDCAERAERAIDALVQERGEAWTRAVDVAVFALHMEVLGEKCWPEGWQPADVARCAVRRLGAGARQVMADLMAAQLRAYAPASVDDRWHDQLAELGAKVWWPADAEYVSGLMHSRSLARTEALDLLVRLLGLLAGLPRLEPLGPLPGKARGTGGVRRPDSAGSAGSTGAANAANPAGSANATGPNPGVNEKLLARVRALLAKAEATSYPAEAETFTTAAQAMMARHSIDAAMLHSGPGRGEGRPGGIRLGVDNPYSESKAMLVQQIAETNRCRAVWSKHLGFTTVLGFDADVRWVELLYTSLLVQATAAMSGAGAKTDAWGGSRTRSFRSSFLQAFAMRIGERLGETTRQAEADAGRESGGRDLLPVLASRRQAVDEELARIFPELIERGGRTRYAGDREGWLSGLAAADVADLAQRRAVRKTVS
jgi:Protein of unknown function (DUF2786)